MEIVAKKISKKSLFKLLFLGLTAGLSVFAIFVVLLLFSELKPFNGMECKEQVSKDYCMV